MNIENDSWDPLETANQTDQDVITAAKKREIKNILKSYVGSFDPMSELIQNAMDAVERRLKKTPNFDPKIIINIDIPNNSFQIIDNGCGFEQEQFKAFLAPNISFKKDNSSRGNKGVGITYIAYGFNYIEMRTKNSQFQYEAKLENGREWVEDQSGTFHRPRIKRLKSSDDIFNTVDQGASFKIIFGGQNTRPSSLSWYGANTPEQWLYLLLIKTPLGHINLPSGNPSHISFDLFVTDFKGEQRSICNQFAKYKYPHEEINGSQQLNIVTQVQQKALNEGLDPSRLIEKYTQMEFMIFLKMSTYKLFQI